MSRRAAWSQSSKEKLRPLRQPRKPHVAIEYSDEVQMVSGPVVVKFSGLMQSCVAVAVTQSAVYLLTFRNMPFARARG